MQAGPGRARCAGRQRGPGIPVAQPSCASPARTAQRGVPLPLSSAVRPGPRGAAGHSSVGCRKRRWPPAHPPLGGPPSILHPWWRKNRGGFAQKDSLRTGLSGGRRGFLPLFARLSGRMKEFCPAAAQPWPGRAPGRAVGRLFPAESTWLHSGFKQKGRSVGSLVGFYFFYFFYFLQKTTATPFCENIFLSPPLPPVPPNTMCFPWSPLPLTDTRPGRRNFFSSPFLLFIYLFI